MPSTISVLTKARRCQKERYAAMLLSVAGMGGSLMSGVGNVLTVRERIRSYKVRVEEGLVKVELEEEPSRRLHRLIMRNLWMALSIVPNCLNRTAAHCFLAKRSFLFSRRLPVDKRVVLLVAPHKIVRCGVAAYVAIDARRVYVINTADILFYFVVLVRHANSADRDASSLPGLLSDQTLHLSDNRVRQQIPVN